MTIRNSALEVDPSKCTAYGPGIAGGTVLKSSSFTVFTNDANGNPVTNGGARIDVNLSPGFGIQASEQKGIVHDIGNGTYAVNYILQIKGKYEVTVECNGISIEGSPFWVVCSVAGMNVDPLSTLPYLVYQTMPNMPNYTEVIPRSFRINSDIVPGASGGATFPGIGQSLGEVCREYLNGHCAKTDCEWKHPPRNFLMNALAQNTNSEIFQKSEACLAPSAAAMVAAHAIVAAQALQTQSSGSPDKIWNFHALKKTLQVSHLNPLLTVKLLKQIFSSHGTVVECTVPDSKHFAYIEYSKPEEATAALELNNMDVGGIHLNVEMAFSFPFECKPALLKSSLVSSSLPRMMQQAVDLQHMQYRQAVHMQQTMKAQQEAN